jgi:putative transposase
VDDDLAKQRIEVTKTAFRAPNTNAYVERFIQTVQQECLDHFLIFGHQHFDYLVAEWLELYHTERPHQAMGNELAGAASATEEANAGGELFMRRGVGCRERWWAADTLLP